MATLSTAAQRRLKRQRQKSRRQDKEEHEDEGQKDTQDEGQDEGLLCEFANVFTRFAFPPQGEGEEGEEGNQQPHETDSGDESFEDENISQDMLTKSEATATESQQLSKKKLRRLNRMTLAQLKQYSKHPEVVEWEDVTAKDPRLLVQLKAVRHAVPIPRHWCQKRKYLSGKRGYVKPPFELPSFIKDTGITELREAMRAEDATKRTKVKAREKMHPKLGRITVDYERLHDAFFRYQTRPSISRHGELYYEGKEFDGHNDKKPGFLSEELRIALGITSHLMPPPWLHNMQKYGPPPSYAHMKIPGLNAPIPDGAQWGYHPGGWGKPPMDNFLRESLAKNEDPIKALLLVPVERNIWGELEPDEEQPSVDIPYEPEEHLREMVLDEEQAQSFQQSGVPPDRSGFATPASTAYSIPPPDESKVIELRKDRSRNK